MLVKQQRRDEYALVRRLSRVVDAQAVVTVDCRRRKSVIVQAGDIAASYVLFLLVGILLVGVAEPSRVVD